uniref:Large ribosomal subunit protein uL3c n=1 Tax=Ectocarpus siliculosus TaxID=2880 RepID=D1J752_ECTSI|nr:50S ribosomal protein L3 [Ectocarpus siliculosus]CAT18766.1 Chloroplast 50S ribosomal protein L3 [Ectocarpus siliculosus]CAV31236.1 Chloroplast 50S ribosomal protein L3 [Ectocarpus siliculosus]
MSIGIFGNKIGMTQIFDKNGLALPVTVVSVGPCFITQLKTEKTNGYDAIQIGYSKGHTSKFSKAELGHLEKNGLSPLYHLCEYRVNDLKNYSLGQILTVDNFQVGQFVNVTGKSIGKGFSGNQKRHKFKRGPMTHGSKNHRAPGSIGPGTTPGRVFPGKLMAGQLGAKKITVSKLEILGIDSKQNLLILKGSVPGKPGNLLNIINSK